MDNFLFEVWVQETSYQGHWHEGEGLNTQFNREMLHEHENPRAKYTCDCEDLSGDVPQMAEGVVTNC